MPLASLSLFTLLLGEPRAKLEIGKRAPTMRVQQWLSGTPPRTNGLPTLWVAWGTFNEPRTPALGSLRSFARSQGRQLPVMVVSINEQGPSPAAEVKAYAQKFAAPNLHFGREFPNRDISDRWIMQTMIDVTPAAFLVDAKGTLRFMGHVDEAIVAAKNLLQGKPLPESRALRESKAGRHFGKIINRASEFARKGDYATAFRIVDRLGPDEREGGTMWKVIWTAPAQPALASKVLADVRRDWLPSRWHMALAGLESEDVAPSRKAAYNAFRIQETRRFLSAMSSPEPMLLATAALVYLHAEQPAEGEKLIRRAQQLAVNWKPSSLRRKELDSAIESFRKYGD